MFVRGIHLDNYVPQVDLISDKEKLKEDNITLYPTGSIGGCEKVFVRGIHLDNYVPQVDLISDKEKLKEDNITLYPTGKYWWV